MLRKQDRALVSKGKSVVSTQTAQISIQLSEPYRLYNSALNSNKNLTILSNLDVVFVRTHFEACHAHLSIPSDQVLWYSTGNTMHLRLFRHKFTKKRWWTSGWFKSRHNATTQSSTGVFAAVRGQVPNLLRHPSAASVIDELYNVATAAQRNLLAAEYYGTEYSLLTHVACSPAFHTHTLLSVFLCFVFWLLLCYRTFYSKCPANSIVLRISLVQIFRIMKK